LFITAPWAVGLAARWSEAAEKGSRRHRTPPADIIGARSHLPTRFRSWASEMAPEPLRNGERFFGAGRGGSARLGEPLPGLPLPFRGKIVELRVLRLAALPAGVRVLLPGAPVAAPSLGGVRLFRHWLPPVLMSYPAPRPPPQVPKRWGGRASAGLFDWGNGPPQGEDVVESQPVWCGRPGPGGCVHYQVEAEKREVIPDVILSPEVPQLDKLAVRWNSNTGGSVREGRPWRASMR